MLPPSYKRAARIGAAVSREGYCNLVYRREVWPLKYSDRDNLVAGLREAADFIEARGLELPIEMYSPFSFGAYFYGEEEAVKAKLKRAAKGMGSAEKDYSGSFFKLVKKFGSGTVVLKFEAPREKVCVKRVVSTRTIPRRIFVEVPNETEEVEDKVEWDCNDPLLAS